MSAFGAGLEVIDEEGATAGVAVRIAGVCLRVRAGATPPETTGSEEVVFFLGIIPVNESLLRFIIGLFYQTACACSKETFYRTYNASVF
jgi:hypothetical protein